MRSAQMTGESAYSIAPLPVFLGEPPAGLAVAASEPQQPVIEAEAENTSPALASSPTHTASLSHFGVAVVQPGARAFGEVPLTQLQVANLAQDLLGQRTVNLAQDPLGEEGGQPEASSALNPKGLQADQVSDADVEMAEGRERRMRETRKGSNSTPASRRRQQQTPRKWDSHFDTTGGCSHGTFMERKRWERSNRPS